MRGRRFEISANGFDPNLEGIGSDPYGGMAALGLAVPSTLPLNPAQRYLFILAQARFGANEKGRIVGLRQYAQIGTLLTSADGLCQYPLNLNIVTPTFKFVDGNISWHLTRVPATTYKTNNANNANELNFLDADTPTLLFENPGPDYRGPNGGAPYGTPVTTDLATFYDLRFPFDRSDMEYLDIEFEGPCRIALWASVRQTDPNTRCVIELPEGVAPSALPPEDAFVANFPQTIYTRVGGSLIFETDNMTETPRELREQPAVIGDCGQTDPRMGGKRR